MTHILTLIGPPAGGDTPLPALADTLAAGLPGNSGADWLAGGVACDFALAAGGNTNALADLIGRAVDGLPVDWALQPAEDRRKRLLIADMDSTIIDQECIDELGAALGIKADIAAITERAMRGEIDFVPAVRERVALLKGLKHEELARVFKDRITIRPGARTLVRTMRANGAHTALVSGGFTFFTDRVADAVGFDENKANSLKFTDGVLDGTVSEPILGAQAKLTALHAYVDRLRIRPSQTIAVGDGANDLAMISAAGLGVAFKAKPAVAAAADACVNHADLSALLYIQGYRRSEFAE